MTTELNQGSIDERKITLGRRLEDFGWAALLIAIGTIWLVPNKLIPQGSWLIAAGLILLGLNAIRYFSGIETSGFSLLVGSIALVVGLGEWLGLPLPLIPIALIVIGVGLLLKPLFEKESASKFGRGWCCSGHWGRGIDQDGGQRGAVRR